jgi:hypothetical protein
MARVLGRGDESPVPLEDGTRILVPNAVRDGRVCVLLFFEIS